MRLVKQMHPPPNHLWLTPKCLVEYLFLFEWPAQFVEQLTLQTPASKLLQNASPKVRIQGLLSGIRFKHCNNGSFFLFFFFFFRGGGSRESSKVAVVGAEGRGQKEALISVQVVLPCWKGGRVQPTTTDSAALLQLSWQHGPRILFVQCFNVQNLLSWEMVIMSIRKTALGTENQQRERDIDRTKQNHSDWSDISSWSLDVKKHFFFCFEVTKIAAEPWSTSEEMVHTCTFQLILFCLNFQRVVSKTYTSSLLCAENNPSTVALWPRRTKCVVVTCSLGVWCWQEGKAFAMLRSVRRHICIQSPAISSSFLSSALSSWLCKNTTFFACPVPVLFFSFLVSDCNFKTELVWPLWGKGPGTPKPGLVGSSPKPHMLPPVTLGFSKKLRSTRKTLCNSA